MTGVAALVSTVGVAGSKPDDEDAAGASALDGSGTAAFALLPLVALPLLAPLLLLPLVGRGVHNAGAFSANVLGGVGAMRPGEAGRRGCCCLGASCVSTVIICAVVVRTVVPVPVTLPNFSCGTPEWVVRLWLLPSAARAAIEIAADADADVLLDGRLLQKNSS